jgi:flagellar hook assembly protein FlgD
MRASSLRFATLPCALLIHVAPALATNVPGGTITTNTTWNVAGSPYIIQGNVIIAGGAVLTIDPGVDVRFGGDFSLTIGGSAATGNGTLTAVGNSTSPITFRTNLTPGPGRWRYVQFNAFSTASSQLAFCSFSDGGSASATIYCNGGSPTISDVSVTTSLTDGITVLNSSSALSNITIGSFGATSDGIEFNTSNAASLSGTNNIAGSGGNGVQFANASPAIAGLTIGTVTGYALLASSATSLPSFSGIVVQASAAKLGKGGADWWANFLNSAPSIAGSSYIQEVYASTLTKTTTWGTPPIFSKVQLLGTLTIQGVLGPELTLPAGSIVELPASTDVNVGGTTAGQSGALRALGTSLQPVLFRRSAAGNWRTLQFQNNAIDAQCQLTWCQLLDGGTTTAVLQASNASPSLQHVTITGSTTIGLRIVTGSPSVSDLSVQNSGGDAINISGVSTPAFSGSLSSSGNATSYLLQSTSVGSAPTFSSVTLTTSGKLVRGEADLWANLLGSAPSITGSGFEQEVLASTLTKNTTWGALPAFSAVNLAGTLTIQGALQPVLTLTPGTLVKLAAGADIVVGGGSASLGGDLIASGTTSQHITFQRAATGKWRYIQFQNFSTDLVSRLEWCDLIDCGSTTAALYCLTASPLISHVSIANSATVGLLLSTSNATVADLAVSAAVGDAMQLTSSAPSLSGSISSTGSTGYLINASTVGFAPTFTAVTLSSSGKLARGEADFWANLFNASTNIVGTGYEQEILASTLSKTTTFGASPAIANLHLFGSLTIQGTNAPVLTLAPGTLVRLEASLDVLVGGTSLTNPGSLVAAGNPGQHIVFQKAATNRWRNLSFRDGANDAICQVRWCDFQDGGSTTATIIVDTASPAIADVTITNSGSVGLSLTGCSSSLSNITIATPTGDGISLVTGAPTLSGNFSLSGASTYLFKATGSVTDIGFSSVTLASSGQLVSAGTDVWREFFAASPVVVGGPFEGELLTGTVATSATWGGLAGISGLRSTGSLTVAGTTTPKLTIAPGMTLRFPSATSLSVGTTGARGILSAVGGTATPIVFTGTTTTPGFWTGLNYVNTTSDSVLDHCLVQYGGAGSTNCNVRTASSNPVFKNSTISDGDGFAFSVLGTGIPSIQNCSIQNNGAGGITGTTAVSAALNWWGSSTGPSGSGPGSGQSVGTGVTFEPWLTTAPSDPFQWTDAIGLPDPFSQAGGSTVFLAGLTEPANWAITIRDATSTVVRSFSGAGTAIAQPWIGDATGGGALPDGAYSWTMTATSTSSGAIAAPGLGSTSLIAALPQAAISSPLPNAFVAGTVPVTGTAAGATFASYRLEYGVGLAPTSWIVITPTNTTPVTNGLLGNWNATALAGNTYSLRLTVTPTSGTPAVVQFPVRILTITGLTATPPVFSPNGDGIQESSVLAANASFAMNWTVDIKNSAAVIVRSISGGSRAIQAEWDGRDTGGSVVPDGSYTYSFHGQPVGGGPVASSTNATVIVDNTVPTGIITAPAELVTIYVDTPLAIVGTVDDLNFLNATLERGSGFAPTSYVPIDTQTTPVLNNTIDTDDVSALPAGDYTYRLIVRDDGGNSFQVLRHFHFDPFRITNVVSAPRLLNPYIGDSTTVTFQNNRPADFTLRVYANAGHALVRTIVANGLAAGANAIPWDGQGEAAATLPVGAYYFTLTGIDGFGAQDVYGNATSPPPGPTPATTNGTVDATNFDPYQNDVVTMEYDFSQIGLMTMEIRQGSLVVRHMFTNGIRTNGHHVEIWDGRKDDGTVFAGTFTVYFGVPGPLPENAVVLQSVVPDAEALRTEAWLIQPLFREISSIQYTLASPTLVTISLVDPNGNAVRTLIAAASQTPGPHEIEWDGRDNAGAVVTLEGDYRVTIACQDAASGATTTRTGAIQVYR